MQWKRSNISKDKERNHKNNKRNGSWKIMFINLNEIETWRNDKVKNQHKIYNYLLILILQYDYFLTFFWMHFFYDILCKRRLNTIYFISIYFFLQKSNLNLLKRYLINIKKWNLKYLNQTLYLFLLWI